MLQMQGTRPGDRPRHRRAPDGRRLPVAGQLGAGARRRRHAAGGPHRGVRRHRAPRVRAGAARAPSSGPRSPRRGRVALARTLQQTLIPPAAADDPRPRASRPPTGRPATGDGGRRRLLRRLPGRRRRLARGGGRRVRQGGRGRRRDGAGPALALGRGGKVGRPVRHHRDHQQRAPAARDRPLHHDHRPRAAPRKPIAGRRRCAPAATRSPCSSATTPSRRPATTAPSWGSSRTPATTRCRSPSRQATCSCSTPTASPKAAATASSLASPAWRTPCDATSAARRRRHTRCAVPSGTRPRKTNVTWRSAGRVGRTSARTGTSGSSVAANVTVAPTNHTRPTALQCSFLMTKYEPRMVPASLDFCRANLKEESSSGMSMPSESLNPTARLPPSSSPYITLIDRPLS